MEETHFLSSKSHQIHTQKNILNDEFYRIVQNADQMGFKLYEFPIFKDLDISKSIIEQSAKPIASWLDVKSLEEARKRDPIMFARENLCQIDDESVAFLSLDLIRSCAIMKDIKLKTENIYCGIDVGRFHDLTAIEIFNKVGDNYYHIDEIILNNVSIPDQSKIIQDLNATYNFENINIDATGMGLGLSEYLQEAMGYKVTPRTFTKNFKEKIATQMRNKMQDGQIFLKQNQKLINDLHSVEYGKLDAKRQDGSHGDRFWACALALYSTEMDWSGDIPIFGKNYRVE